jgi:HTH-type transcriptional regulator / antitoxin HigA
MSFDPDWTISPGETLRDWMEETGLSPRVTARACGLTVEEVQGILDARTTINAYRAARLECVTMIPARLWLNLERQYRDDLRRGRTDVSN